MNALCLAAALLLSAAPPPARVVDRVAATVDGDTVTLSELVDRAGADYQRAEALPPGEARERARAKALRAALDQIVAEKLFAAQATALQVEVTDAQVDAAIDDIKKRNRFDDAMLAEALAQQGLTRESFRKQVKRDLEAFQILNFKVRSRVKVSDDDVRNYYQTHQELFAGDDQVRVRHIFLAVPAKATEADSARVQAEAERVLKRLADGQDFATLAREVSQGPSRDEGGDLGWLKRGTIQPELERAAFSLKPGQVSGIVRTRTGLHILKVEDRRVGQPRPFDEVKDEIRDRLTNEQVETYRTQYVAELKKDASIDVRMPELRLQ